MLSTKIIVPAGALAIGGGIGYGLAPDTTKTVVKEKHLSLNEMIAITCLMTHHNMMHGKTKNKNWVKETYEYCKLDNKIKPPHPEAPNAHPFGPQNDIVKGRKEMYKYITDNKWHKMYDS